jgi:hypothetical protein
MTSPNPRSKLLPARGNKADLEFWIEDILEGEMVYAYDEDQYYQKEGEFLVPVGATKVQGALADTALQDAPDDQKQYGRSGGTCVEIDTTDTGAVGAGTTGQFPYYGADGQVLSTAGSAITLDTNNGQVNIDKIGVNEFNLSGDFNIDNINLNGTGPARIDSGSDIILAPTTDIDVTNSKIRNLADPLLDQDAATRAFVYAVVAEAVGQYPAYEYTFDPTLGSYWFVKGPGIVSTGAIDPELILYKGMRYVFKVINNDNAEHRLFIKNTAVSGTNDQFDDAGTWVTGDPYTTQFFEVPFQNIGLQLFYVSDVSSSYAGALLIRPDEIS